MKKETRKCWILFIGIVGIVTIFTYPFYQHRLNIKIAKIEREAEISAQVKADDKFTAQKIELENNYTSKTQESDKIISIQEQYIKSLYSVITTLENVIRTKTGNQINSLCDQKHKKQNARRRLK